jgi:hypothetical protein
MQQQHVSKPGDYLSTMQQLRHHEGHASLFAADVAIRTAGR